MHDIYLGKVTEGFSDILNFQMTAIKNVRLGVKKFYPHIYPMSVKFRGGQMGTLGSLDLTSQCRV